MAMITKNIILVLFFIARNGIALISGPVSKRYNNTCFLPGATGFTPSCNAPGQESRLIVLHCSL
jgi:hypothetical protein